jgi:hypothetical protein
MMTKLGKTIRKIELPKNKTLRYLLIGLVIIIALFLAIFLPIYFFVIQKPSNSSSDPSPIPTTTIKPGPTPTPTPTPPPPPPPPPGPVDPKTFPRPFKPVENSKYNTLKYPTGTVDDGLEPNFPFVNCTTMSKPNNWPPTDPNQKILPASQDTGNIKFLSVITEDVYNMMFPYHNKKYSYSGLKNAILIHPEGWRLGGEGSNDTRYRDIAAFLANCAHEVGNGNGPSIITNNGIDTTKNNGPWSSDSTYFGDVWGQKYFKCYCGGGIWGKDCNEISTGSYVWNRYTNLNNWCGSNTNNDVWKEGQRPNGWIGALTCIDEGCPEYPPGMTPPSVNIYCQSDASYPTDPKTGVVGGTISPPCSAEQPCPCYKDKKYFGRGPIQLSYNFNYGVFSYKMNAIGITNKLFGVNDPLYLLKNPDLVNSNDTLLWLTAIDFWCSNRSNTYNYLSCHDAMVLGCLDTKTYPDHGFGVAINIVNGGCPSLQSTVSKYGQPYKNPTDDNANRGQWYQVFTYAFGITP